MTNDFHGGNWQTSCQLNLAHKLKELDYQALLKAKYCTRVAAVSRTEKTPKTHVSLTLDLEIQ